MDIEKHDSHPSLESDGAASHAEIEILVGGARAAIAEITSLQQVAAKAAADAELSMTKAAEHLKEVEAKRDAAAQAEMTIKDLSEKSATGSAHIDDGAKFAISAKEQIATTANEACEVATRANEQATKASELLDSATALLEEITQKRSAVDPLVAEITEHSNSMKAMIAATENAEAEANSSRDLAKASAQLSATDCKNVQDGKEFIEAQRTRAEQCANEAKTKLDEAINTVAAVQAALTKIGEDKEKATSDLEEIIATASQVNEAMSAAQEDQKTTAALAQIADSIKDRVQSYEVQLDTMSVQFEEVRKKIESLLPGAASAGLAAAFHAQKDKYIRPKSLWNIVFFTAILGIAALGIAEIARHWSDTTPNYDELLRSFLTRITVIVALIWLALHASGKSRIANQIQEDYTYKEAVSRSFEGYKKEFASLPDHVAAGSPLATLCHSMVTILASSPSRVYDKHAYDATPMSTFTEAAKQLTELAKEANIKPKVSAEIKAGTS